MDESSARDLLPSSVLSRFLFYKKHINYEKVTVNSSVFSEKHPNGFSVFDSTLLEEEQIWKLAIDYVVNENSGRPLLGRGDLGMSYYNNAGLVIQRDMPPPRHYNVLGMPVSSALKAAKALSNRQLMVAHTKFVSYNSAV